MQHSMVKNLNLPIIKRISFLSVFLLLAFTGPKYVKLISIPSQSRFITTDNLRNVYLIGKDNTLIMYDHSGWPLFTYEEKRYGQMTLVDARNPFKILVLCPDFSTIITLDNTLSPTTTINLLDLGITSITTVCRSVDDKVWIYDEQDLKIKKIDDHLQVMLESDELFKIISDKVIHPNFMMERNNWLYINDPENGILVFDIYASYYKTIPIKGLVSFQIIDDYLIYYKDGALMSYHTKTLEENIIQIPVVDDFMHIRIEKDRLYLLSKNQLDLYSVQD